MRLIASRIIGLVLVLAFVGTFAFAQTSTTTTKKETKTTAKAEPNTGTATKVELLDLNSATKEQLVALPGIGEVYAKKIIEGRPYANKGQLVSRNIISDGLYKKISDKVIAKQSKEETKAVAKTKAPETKKEPKKN